ncbi:MAG: DUF417 family protein [Nitriliruptoraceae bacterium]
MKRFTITHAFEVTMRSTSDNRRADALPAAEIARRWWERYEAIDIRVLETLRRISLPMLRLSLGVIFVWFGALKIAGISPASELVAATVYLVDPAWFVPFLGGVEVLIGLGLIANRAMRLVLPVFVGLLTGTLMVLVMLPEVAFQDGNPLLLSVEGGYVVKNIVLLAAGLVVASSLSQARPWRLQEASDQDNHTGTRPPSE